MTGFFPQAAIHHRRGAHFLIAVFDELLPHVLLDLLPHDPAPGVPEHHARRFFLHVQEVELLGELAVVALLGFLEAMQIGVEVFLLRPRGAVDALQHRVFRIAAPVRTGKLHQLVGFGELAGRRQVRAATHVEPVALPVDRQFLAGRDDVVDDLDLVVLAHGGESLFRRLALPYLALDRQVAFDDLVHALFDGNEVFRGERRLAREIVVEAVLDRRADGHLRARIQLLHRLRHDVRGVVADEVERLGVLRGDDGERRVGVDHMAGINQLAVDLAGERRLGEAGADAGGDLGDGHRRIELSDRTIG